MTLTHKICLSVFMLFFTACGEDIYVDVTPPTPPGLDLYIQPAFDSGAWHVQLKNTHLSTDLLTHTALTLPAGGVTKGSVNQPLRDDAPSVQPEQSRVIAIDNDGLIYAGFPGEGDFRQNFTLAIPEGDYGLWIEPLDAQRPPMWFESVSLPAASLPIVSVDGESLSGRLINADSGLGLVDVQVTTLNPTTLRRSGGLGTTTSSGAFSIQVPIGSHLLTARRNVVGAASAEAEIQPLPLLSLAEITVEEGGQRDLLFEVSLPLTEELIGNVANFNDDISDVTLVATRVTDTGPFGGLTVTVISGGREQLSSGVFALPLPEGAYALTLTPPTDGDSLAPILFQGGSPIEMFGASLDTDISLPDLITGLSGSLSSESTSTGPQGTSLLILPETAIESRISTQARGADAIFEVGVTPTGLLPITVSEGNPQLVLMPPLGSPLARQSFSASIVRGQSELVLPALKEGYQLYGQLQGENVANFENAVVKAVLEGSEAWARKWGPGPDPSMVVAEALVQADGSFTLVLAYPE